MGKKKRTIFKRNRIRENDEHSGRVYYENAFDVRSKRYEFPSHELINAFLRIFFHPTTMEFPSTHPAVDVRKYRTRVYGNAYNSSRVTSSISRFASSLTCQNYYLVSHKFSATVAGRVQTSGRRPEGRQRRRIFVRCRERNQKPSTFYELTFEKRVCFLFFLFFFFFFLINYLYISVFL